MSRERFDKDDYVIRGHETGRVCEQVSKRTGKPYLYVRVLTGPKKNTREWPENGWRVDMGDVGGNERSAHEPEGYLGSEAHKTAHHSRRG